MIGAKLIALGIVVVTSYRPVPEQTKPECTGRHHCETANGNNVSMYGVAVSQDWIRAGILHFGDALYVPGYGIRVIDDVMGPRATHAIDLLVFTKAQEHKVGVKHLQVYKIEVIK